MNHMIENKYNKQVGNVYEQMLINEANEGKLEKELVKWEKRYINLTTNKNKVKLSLERIKQLLGSTEDNFEIMDDITQQFITISKYIKDDEMGEKIKDELSNILEKI